jgi:ABC-type transport system involved in cytochrome c biogenesis permease subunit
MGYPPFINGYGSMIFFSFIIILKTLFFHKETPLKLKQAHILFAEIMIVGSFFMPFKLSRVQAVLTSYWLGIHVPLFFIGYLSLTTAFFASFFPQMKQMEKKEMKLALLFIFSGIITGAFWAEISWGRFWGWDSKEVWALSTWLFVLSYFHFKNKKEQKMAIITAFISMILTYIVVSFIVPGAHNYFQ